MRPTTPEVPPPPWLTSALRQIPAGVPETLRKRAAFFLGAVEHETLPEPEVQRVAEGLVVTWSWHGRVARVLIPHEGPVRVGRAGPAGDGTATRKVRWEEVAKDVVPQLQGLALWVKEAEPWKP